MSSNSRRSSTRPSVDRWTQPEGRPGPRGPVPGSRTRGVVSWLTGGVSSRHIVVDGSNLATEGRTTPSLVQLEEAVAELRRELDEAEVIVVVDASFTHRIEPSERPRFEELVAGGELVSPPAGAVGRGDAFLLRIAEKVGGVVVSNDSFQEFHGEHPWLFANGRLLGARKVPGVGWIFVARNPVRGPRSRVAVREASRAKKKVEKAIAVATKEVTAAAPRVGAKALAASRTAAPRAVNDPMTFIAFIADHPLGSEIEAAVESFSSHGAVVRTGELRAYVPLSGLGDPAPRSARTVLKKDETRRFVVTALDPYRRGVELALPGAGVVSGRPSEETVAAVVKMAKAGPATSAAPAGGTRRRPAARAPTPKVAKSSTPHRLAARRPGGRGVPSGRPATRAQLRAAPKTAPAAVAGKTAAPRRSPRAMGRLANPSTPGRAASGSAGRVADRTGKSSPDADLSARPRAAKGARRA